MFKGYVYKCLCLISNKIYVGLTTSNLEKRKKEHIYSSFNEKSENYKSHFHSAIRKYGIENFEWKIVVSLESESLEDLNISLRELEKFYIKKFNSFENGYNLTPGGELTFKGNPKIVNMYDEDGKLLDTGTIGFLSFKYNLDTSAICKVCSKIYNFSGKLNGKKLIFRYIEDGISKEELDHIKSITKGNKKGKSVIGYSYETGQEIFRFNSVKEASQVTGINYRALANCAAGNSKYSGKINGVKIVWRYIE